MAPGKGFEPLRAQKPTGLLVLTLSVGFDLEASAITAPPPRHCVKGFAKWLLALSNEGIMARYIAQSSGLARACERRLIDASDP